MYYPVDGRAPLRLNVEGVAEMAGVHPATIYRMIERGEFPVKPLAGFRRLQFSRVMVERWLGGELDHQVAS